MSNHTRVPVTIFVFFGLIFVGVEALGTTPQFISYCDRLLQARVPVTNHQKIATAFKKHPNDPNIVGYLGLGIQSFQMLLRAGSVPSNSGLGISSRVHSVFEETDALTAGKFDARLISRAEVAATKSAAKNPDPQIYQYMAGVVQNTVDPIDIRETIARFVLSDIPDYQSPMLFQGFRTRYPQFDVDMVRNYFKFITFGEWLGIPIGELLDSSSSGFREVSKILRVPKGDAGYIIGLSPSTFQKLKGKDRFEITIDEIYSIQGASKSEHDYLQSLTDAVEQ